MPSGGFVQPNFKPSGPCGCGCGKEGTLRVRPWRSNGVTCVTRGCPCKQCMGKANQSRGRRSQTKAARRMHIRPTTHEENMRGAHRVQHKEDKAHAGPIYRVWDRLLDEDNYKRPLGDTRPLVQSFSQQGRSGGLLLIEDTDEAVWALAVQRGFVQ